MASFIIPIQNRGILAVTGKDRQEFLQGLITNDIYDLKENKGLYSALLTPQGKFLYDFFLYEHGETIYLIPEANRLESLKNKLVIYKLNLDVSIDIISNLSFYAIFGNVKDHSMVFQDPRHQELGHLALLASQELKNFSEINGLTLESFAQYDLLRIQLGVPDGSRDMEIDKGIILENGLDELNAISWTKGCYMGQELTARTKHRGLVRKQLLPVLIEGINPIWGEEVFLNQVHVGEVRSSIENWGLALIRLGAFSQNAIFETKSGVKLKPYVPSWMEIKLSSAQETKEHP